jgi:MOSC domain-containing protein YiiM
MLLRELLSSVPQIGRVEWIGLRPVRREPLHAVESVEAQPGRGLTGDHFRGSASSARQVTLIQHEHLDVVARLLRRERLDPALLRRNLVVSGVNLEALRGACFRIGAALLRGSGACHPCSRMEEALGPGGHAALRGHGGITARVLESGRIRIGDEVRFVSVDAPEQDPAPESF